MNYLKRFEELEYMPSELEDFLNRRKSISQSKVEDKTITFNYFGKETTLKPDVNLRVGSDKLPRQNLPANSRPIQSDTDLTIKFKMGQDEALVIALYKSGFDSTPKLDVYKKSGITLDLQSQEDLLSIIQDFENDLPFDQNLVQKVRRLIRPVLSNGEHQNKTFEI